MLTLIEGALGSGVREEIKIRIAKNIEKKQKCVLIVPEQQTVTAEKELAAELDPSAPLYFEVTNFTRFANTAFRKLGGIQKKYADNVRKSLIMWQTLTELSPFLSLTLGKKEISTGIAERAMAAVKEAEALGLDAKTLADAARSEGIGRRLSDKLSDLASILALYKEKLTERFADTADDCDLLVKKLKENEAHLSDTEIFLEGFTSFTVPQYALIAELILHTGVTVCLNIPKADSSAFEYSEIVLTRGKLSALCDKKGIDKKILKLDGRVGTKSETLGEVCRLLWKSNLCIDNFNLHSDEELRVFEAANPFEECEFIASDIRRRVMAGASYKDFAIVMANTSDYDGILDTGLDKAGIVHFTSAKSELMNFEAIKLVFAALAASRTFSRADVLAYAASGLSGISREERDEFEIYVDKWQIDGSRFTDGVVWNMNPLGFDNKKSPDHDEILARIDATRVKLITPLMHLSQQLSSSVSVKDHATALVDFLEDINLEAALEERTKKLSALGEKNAVQDNLRLYSIICSALDTLVDTFGDSKTDKETFSAQLKIVFSASKIGRIPSSYDEVMIGSADMLRLHGKKHLYLIGVNYGKFPAPSSDSSYFTDKDKEFLTSLGLEADTNSEIRTARSLFSFSRAFATAGESVTVTYSRTDASFSALSPSFVIENIERLTNKAVKPKKISEVPPRDKFYAPGIAYESLNECSEKTRSNVKGALRALGDIRVFDDVERIDNGSLSLSAPTDAGTLYLTQTRIDTFVSCPLKYFCKFTLSLSEGERARFGSNNIGSYIHAILENFFAEVKRRNLKLGELGEEERSDMTRRAAKAYLDEFSDEIGTASARTRSALSKIYRAARPVVDGLCEEFEKSAFTPMFFELPISRIAKDGPAPVEITGEGGEKICIYGTIDRVDTYKRGDDVYVRVVDYKTGSKDFKPEELSEGKNLQMFLYLKSIVECDTESFKESLGACGDGKVLPAALIYVKTDIGDKHISAPSDDAAKEEVRKAQKRMGMILNEPEIMNAMGRDFLPVKLTKDGVFKKHEKFLFTPEGWQEISDTVESAVAKIGHRIAKGEIKAASGKDAKKKSPCEYCSYKAFCRNLKL